MTDGERDLLVTTAKLLRSQLEDKLKSARGPKKEKVQTDLAQLQGALAPFDHDAPIEGAPV